MTHIQKSDLLYFTEPLPQPIIPKQITPGLKVFVEKTRYPHADTKPGSIVEIGDFTVDQEVWWTTAVGGRNVLGHVINEHSFYRNTGPRIAPITDELFALVNVLEQRAGNLMAQCEVVAMSDTEAHPNGGGTGVGLFPITIPAATWARDYMPRPGDSEEVVADKVALAKQRWEQRQKAVQIIREGQERNWLHHLDGLRTDHSRFLPLPLYDVYVTGNVMIPTGTTADEAVIESTVQRMSRMGTTTPPPPVEGATIYVAAPMKTVLSLGVAYEQAQSNDSTLSTLRNQMTSVYGDRTVGVTPTSMYPILSSAIH